MHYIILKNNNGPHVMPNPAHECNTQLRFVCGKNSLAEILAQCQYFSHDMPYSEKEIKKITSEAAQLYAWHSENHKKLIKK